MHNDGQFQILGADPGSSRVARLRRVMIVRKISTRLGYYAEVVDCGDRLVGAKMCLSLSLVIVVEDGLVASAANLDG